MLSPIEEQSTTFKAKSPEPILGGILTTEDSEVLAKYFGIVVPPGIENKLLKQVIRKGSERIKDLQHEVEKERQANIFIRKERDMARLELVSKQKDRSNELQAVDHAYRIATEHNVELRAQVSELQEQIDAQKKELVNYEQSNAELTKKRDAAIVERDRELNVAIGYRDELETVRYLVDEIERAIKQENPPLALEHIKTMWELLEPREQVEQFATAIKKMNPHRPFAKEEDDEPTKSTGDDVA